MATAKKRSKKPAARKRAPKKVTRKPIGRCTDVGNELKTRGTSAAAVKARAHGGVCLRKQSKSWRPVKTKTFIVPPRAAARRARLARAAKRRRAEKNGSKYAVTTRTGLVSSTHTSRELAYDRAREKYRKTGQLYNVVRVPSSVRRGMRIN